MTITAGWYHNDTLGLLCLLTTVRESTSVQLNINRQREGKGGC